MKIYLSLVLLMISSLTFSQDSSEERAKSSDWRHFAREREYNIKYDARRSKKEGNFVTAWMQYIPHKEYLAAARADLITRAPEFASAFKKYAYRVEKTLYNCETKSYTILRMLYYDTNGNVILDQDYEKDNTEKWEETVPNSRMGAQLFLMCNYLELGSEK